MESGVDMPDGVRGLHHITSLASDAGASDRFFTGALGLRRVKKTVNFDAPEIYHLYYGDETGTPGSVMTTFPFGHIARGTRGTGEVGTVEFAVPEGALDHWKARLAGQGVPLRTGEGIAGDRRLDFEGPDGEALALIETAPRGRHPWTGSGIDSESGILGFDGARLRLHDAAATGELLGLLGYHEEGREGRLTRYRIEGGNGADRIDIEERPDMEAARQGAGSVHHIAFSVEDRAAQSAMRDMLIGAGYEVTPPIDRQYFHAIYFRSPGGVLFEIATDPPGFEHDEDRARLGEALKLPDRYAPDRVRLERILPDIDR